MFRYMHRVAAYLLSTGLVLFAAPGPAEDFIDLDSDNDIDVLSASGFDDKIAWYENDGNQNFTTRTISTNADFAVSVYAIDLDDDKTPLASVVYSRRTSQVPGQGIITALVNATGQTINQVNQTACVPGHTTLYRLCPPVVPRD